MQTLIMIEEQFILQLSGILIMSEEIQKIMLKGLVITMQEGRIFISLPRWKVKIKAQVKVQIPWLKQEFLAFR